MRDSSFPGQYGPGAAPGGSGYLPGEPGGSFPPPPLLRRSRLRAGVLSHLLVAVLAAGLAVGVTVAVDRPAPGGTAASPAPLPGAGAVPAPAAPPAAGRAGALGMQQVVDKVVPGLVVINTSLQYNSAAAAGTGMVISPGGLVLTNNHVIEDATRITATAVATGKTYPARVIGYDKSRDVALLQLLGASGLRTVPVGNSAAVRPGAPVVALGNAEGQGTIIPAAGRVTGIGKTITATDQGGTASTETLHGMIEVSAGIVSGDSGGPLATLAGQVIGMATAGESVSLAQQAPPAGFAIPADTALAVARQIAAGHASSAVTIGYPPFAGIFVPPGTGGSPLAQAQAQQQNGPGGFPGPGGLPGFPGLPGLPGSSGSPATPPACYTSNASLTVPSVIAPARTGALVDGTICGSPAAAAGMTGGSVITAVNGRPVTSPGQLTSILARFRPGTTISVSWVSPGGKHATSSLRLAAGPPQ
jgi:S1-C subfamily serine protease